MHFQALEHLKPSDNCLVGKAPENRDKNRYRDILPCKSERESYLLLFLFIQTHVLCSFVFFWRLFSCWT